MGRKSRTEVRREEILAAFERCIGRDGIDVPLERIADEAGVQRSLIRHYLGNRDELVDQVIARIAEAYPRRAAELLERALERGPEGLLDVLFPLAESADDWDVAAFNEWEAVISAVAGTAQGRYPQAKQRVARMMEEIVERTAAGLQRRFPAAGAAACSEAAYGIFCLVQAHEGMLQLGVDPRNTALARACALRMLAGLAPRAAAQGPRPEA